MEPIVWPRTDSMDDWWKGVMAHEDVGHAPTRSYPPDSAMDATHPQAHPMASTHPKPRRAS
ncbi:hypothetical protein O1W68_20940 [Rhodococcus sp. H36-A4]|uniref:hypothetical protein n=1 Tax=Rhodococcus sp. H36-A4 TaxID=3004353 RepID=UPI0022AFF5BD|nr:hypothetical protein [Rhodococcus sp. H36-A4]MCZ4080413.1 hypothetical protein [Rhodococcus sp. H36-A4]